jgi:DNA replication protein DnaC
MDNQLLSTLKKLRMSGLASTLEIRLHEAATTGLSHREFLELLLQDEMLLRNDRLISRRVALAGFRDTKRLEDFDFSYNQSIKKSQVFDLATCRFIRERRDVLWVGPPGTGKSHLCQALGLSAIRCGMTVYYRIYSSG